ncbi:MAG TPA: DsbA family protein, partial [Microbacterium sp.]|nr:DsbA family protein [Microbacterium sp.]
GPAADLAAGGPARADHAHRRGRLPAAHVSDAHAHGAGSFAAAVATGAGLDADVVASVLADPAAFDAEARADVARAGDLGIQGVPFYVLDGRYGLSGAQPAEVFEQALTQVYDELNPKPASPLASLGGAQGETSGIDGCE